MEGQLSLLLCFGFIQFELLVYIENARHLGIRNRWKLRKNHFIDRENKKTGIITLLSELKLKLQLMF